jgi:ribose 5-phosphate isomerase A
MTFHHLSEQGRLKHAAAARAVEEVGSGMVLGLGSGSTAEIALEILAERVAKGVHITGIPTSAKTAALAGRLGVPLTSFAEHRRIDLTIDGADQVERGTLTLIKGLGGALLHEKIVASVSDRMIVVIDETKLVDRLGGGKPLPVEVVPFGWQTVLDRLEKIGCGPRLRLVRDIPFVTDGGNYIIDCTLATIPDPKDLDARISSIVGVVETGLFITQASTVIVGRPAGVEVIER